MVGREESKEFAWSKVRGMEVGMNILQTAVSSLRSARTKQESTSCSGCGKISPPPCPATLRHSENHLRRRTRQRHRLRSTLPCVPCKVAPLAPTEGFHSLPSEPRLIHFHRSRRLNVITRWPVQSLWERSPFVKQYYSDAMLLIWSLLLVMTSSHMI